MGKFKYTILKDMLNNMYQGFYSTKDLLDPGTIFYFSLNPNFCDLNKYKEDEWLFWVKMMRWTLNIQKALNIWRQNNGYLIAVELDSLYPHFHIVISKILKEGIIDCDGVDLFPWFRFKVQKVLLHNKKPIFYIKQWSCQRESREIHSSLCRNTVKDSYPSITSNKLSAASELSKVFGKKIGYDLLMIDSKTRIPLDDWNC